MLNQASRGVRTCAYQCPFRFFMLARMHEASCFSAKSAPSAREFSCESRYHMRWRVQGAAQNQSPAASSANLTVRKHTQPTSHTSPKFKGMGGLETQILDHSSQNGHHNGHECRENIAQTQAVQFRKDTVKLYNSAKTLFNPHESQTCTQHHSISLL